ILEGHLAAGVFIPEWWSLLKVDGKAEGVLLFNRAADGNTIELVYLGLAREVRGRGLGRVLLSNGLAGLDNARGRGVVLAVDRANGPAVRLYRRFGFRLSIRRIAYVQSITGTGQQESNVVHNSPRT
ncbi:MAG: GNAT family N-acetyltransferase, partial [Phycisphaerales bacterium]|nr:GNAT family N-acetyltransferase [Phycisphaerales bacterium]